MHKKIAYKSKINLALALLLLMGIVWLAKIWLYQPKTAAYVAKTSMVQTILATIQPMPEIFNTIALLKSQQSVLITNGIAGQVHNIIVNDGSYVNANQPLLTLQPEYVVRSPIDGYLTNWSINKGQYLAVGTVLATVVNRQKIAIEYYVPEQYLAKLQLGHPVEVKVRAFPQQTFTGKVDFISPVIELKNHSILVRAAIENTNEQLLPGLFAEVTHIINPNLQALTIAEACLIASMEGYYVYKVLDGQVTRQTVSVGQRAAGKVQILAGLMPGDEVIVTIQPGLKEGSKVQPSLVTAT